MYRIPSFEPAAVDLTSMASPGLASRASTSSLTPEEQASTSRDVIGHLSTYSTGLFIEANDALGILRDIMNIRGEHESPYISSLCGFAIMRYSSPRNPIFEEARQNNLSIIFGASRRTPLETRIDCALRMLGLLNEDPVGPRLAGAFIVSETNKLSVALLDVGHSSHVPSNIRTYVLSFLAYGDYIESRYKDSAKAELRRVVEDTEIPEGERILASEVLLNCKAPLSPDLHLGFGTPRGKIEEVMGGAAAAEGRSSDAGLTLRRAISEYIKP